LAEWLLGAEAPAPAIPAPTNLDHAVPATA